MEVKSHKLGPGSLKFGDVGSEVEFGIGLRECAIEHDDKEEDPIPVLSGHEIPGDAEESYKLTGKILQTYDKRSFIVWARTNRGKAVPFSFTPDNDKDLVVKGRVVVRRLDIGGKVKERNESDFEWRGVDDYELVDNQGAALTWTGPGDEVTPVDSSPAWD